MNRDPDYKKRSSVIQKSAARAGSAWAAAGVWAEGERLSLRAALCRGS